MSNVIEALTKALGSDAVRTGTQIPDRNRTNMRAMPAAELPMPRALVLPRTTQDVAAALKICHALSQPVVTQGGMTGLAGGAHPDAGEVILSLERMTGIEEIDTSSGTMTVLAGTPLQLVHEAADKAGFMYGVDLGARGSCTIGGNVATNAGGNQVLRYGMTRRNVLGLEAVLADGTVVRSLNKMLKNNTGYDWVQLMIGSEGTLGVVTRVVVSLHPKPEGVHCALAAVASFDDALKVLRRTERAFPGGLLTFEGMWSEFYKLATGPMGCSAPLPDHHELYLLMEVATGPDETGRERFEEFLAHEMEAGLLRDAVVAQSGPDRTRIWALRESPYDYGTKLPPAAHISFDVSIPLARMAEAIGKLRQAVPGRWPASTSVAFGHIADSNIHFSVRLPDGGPADAKDVCDVVYGIIGEVAGSVSAEHGIGRIKRPYLKLSRTPAELALMASIKHTLDPRGILNPERVL